MLFVTHEINPILPLVDRVLYLVDGRFRIGTAAEVMTSEVLSELYRTDVEVLHVRGRLVVVGTGDAIDALGSRGAARASTTPRTTHERQARRGDVEDVRLRRPPSTCCGYDFVQQALHRRARSSACSPA